jgi:hypothetical protein
VEKLTGNKDRLITYLCTHDAGALWDLAPHTEKRSLSQNSYYWTLCGKVARKTHISTAEVHNRNLRDLGLFEAFNGQRAIIYIPDTEQAEKQALNSETVHIRPTSQIKVGNDGVTYRAYVMLRGSHSFNTKEFTALLNLMIQDAKAQDIEVLPPAELEHMRALAEQAEKRKGQK